MGAECVEVAEGKEDERTEGEKKPEEVGTREENMMMTPQAFAGETAERGPSPFT